MFTQNSTHIVKRVLDISFVSVITLAAIFALPLSASPISLGQISFNTLIPDSPGFPGVNDFEIDNFTAAFALPPDFPVVDPLAFLSSTLVLTLQGGTQQTFALGDLSPASYTPMALQFSASSNFTSAVFTATLNHSQFSVSDGGAVQALTSQLSITLIPGAGSTLLPDSDFALITVDAQPIITPEPNFSGLCVCLSVGFTALRARKHLRSSK